MNVDDQIKHMEAVNHYPLMFKRHPIEKFILDAYYTFDKRLNNPVWLIEQVKYQHKNEYDIAHEIGCTYELVNKKLKRYDAVAAHDQIFGVYTGFFHDSKKWLRPLLKPYIKKVSQGIDTVYGRTTSRNSTIFKMILGELDAYDDDTGQSMFRELGLSRKEGLLLGLKFLICLCEFDTHYEERFNYILKRIIELKDEFHFDGAEAPDKWYPHRDMAMHMKHMLLRNK